MTYVKTDLGTTIVENRGPGRKETKLSDGALIGPAPGQGWDDPLAAACGFVPIIVDTQPAYDPATEKLVGSLVMQGTEPHREWTVVALTQDELDALAQQAADDAAVTALFGPSTKVPLRALRDRVTPTPNADSTTAHNDLALAVLRIIRELERMQGVDPS